jgi:hypothetical protein
MPEASDHRSSCVIRYLTFLTPVKRMSSDE